MKNIDDEALAVKSRCVKVGSPLNMYEVQGVIIYSKSHAEAVNEWLGKQAQHGDNTEEHH